MRVALVGLFCTACCGGWLADRVTFADQPPNIVLIMADDIGRECFGCYGSQQYETPRIDQLARQGMRFVHCYSQPLCTPSRVKLMTGKSNVRNYSAFSVLNPDQSTFAHSLSDAGYSTFVGGKWQLLGAEHYSERFRAKGTHPARAGFDRHCLWQVDRLGDRYWNPLLCINGVNRQFGSDDYGPAIVTDHILEFIESQRDGPFLVYYPMILTHGPFRTTPHSESRDRKHRQKNFEDMVRYMDHCVGRIVDCIDDQGLAENTLILFTGDNGSPRQITSQWNGGTLRGGKGKTTDAGTRVALVARQTGTVPAGKTSDALIDFSDFRPTLHEIAGIPAPEDTDGISFAPRLRGERSAGRSAIFCYYNPRPERTQPVRFARDRRWKLYGDGRFYDVASDPDESKPLTGASEERNRLRGVLESMPDTGQMLLEFTEETQP